jgi:transposase InsO family protein
LDLCFLKAKNETLKFFKIFKSQTENETSLSIKVLRSNIGVEYQSKAFIEFYEKENIKQQFMQTKTPQQNGVVEWNTRFRKELGP